MFNAIVHRLGWVVAVTLAVSFPFIVLTQFYLYEIAQASLKERVEIRNEIDDLKASKVTLFDGFEDRMRQLENTVYGEVEPNIEAAKKRGRIVTPAEAWQKNRDKELRDRLTALERRVNRLENQDD